MKLAIIKGNRDMASAAFARFDSLPANLRKLITITKKEVSEAMLGSSHLDAVEVVGQADYDLAKGATLIKSLSGAKADPNARIATGMRLRELSHITGRKYDLNGDVVVPGEDDPNNKEQTDE